MGGWILFHLIAKCLVDWFNIKLSFMVVSLELGYVSFFFKFIKLKALFQVCVHSHGDDDTLTEAGDIKLMSLQSHDRNPSQGSQINDPRCE